MTAATTRVEVDVTFLEMSHPPRTPARPLPEGWEVVPEPSPTVALYRALYDGVGRAYCWWMRQVLSDEELAAVLAEEGRRIFLLKEDGVVRGFFELETQRWNIVNLAYFGLLPEAVGRGVGSVFLRAAIDVAWATRPLFVRVNTCSADHPRALPTYLAAGFRVQSVVHEVWDIPDWLGLRAPPWLHA